MKNPHSCATNRTNCKRARKDLHILEMMMTRRVLLLFFLRFLLVSTLFFYSNRVVGLGHSNSNRNKSTIQQQQKMSRPSSSKRLVYGNNDVLFGSVEHQQQGRPFGDVLDAGTGLHSLRWIATLPSKGMESFCAITADETMRRNVQQEAEALGVAHLGTVLVGNWFDQDNPLELEGRKFDTILADYLIGAMDGFSPYQQDRMLHILASYLKPGGRLYIVGLEPIPDKAPEGGGGNNAGANVICRVRQVRDACILLAGHRCYREYPLEWVQRQVYAHPDLAVLESRKFPIMYRHVTIQRQIQVGRSKFKWFPSQSLVESMTQVLDDLEQASLDATTQAPNGKIPFGFDYIVTAAKKVGDDCSGNGLESGARAYHRADTAETG